jgi:hypothetical protein
MLSYSVTLSDALTPITLISGVGLLLLAMTARYNYTTDRVRALPCFTKMAFLPCGTSSQRKKPKRCTI